MKSSPTYFSVKLKNHFSTENTSIPFEEEILNVGGAMNTSSGIFTTPRAGKYFFSFSGLADFPSPSSNRGWIIVHFYVNGARASVGSLGDESNNSMYEHEPIVAQITLLLQAGDQVALQIRNLTSGAFLNLGFCLFTGWLLEEDISQSLN